MPRLFGYSPIPRETQRFVATLTRPTFGLAAPKLWNSGAGQIMLLHKVVERVANVFPIHDQAIGDCVSHGFALAVDILRCVKLLRGGNEGAWGDSKWVATEPLYACSRVEIGGGVMGRDDGSTGAWAAQAVRDYGVLLRQKYEAGGKTFDFTEYSGSLARQWGKRGAGVPDELEPISRTHEVREVTLVTSYTEARDAIYNGFPVVVCSQQGFGETRDKDGFAEPADSWAHCMCFIAVDDAASRKGLLCMNSWGPDWITGPKRLDQPHGSFWVDAEVVEQMLRNDGNPDSFAISDFIGFPSANSVLNLA